MSRPARCVPRSIYARYHGGDERTRLGHLFTSWHTGLGVVCSWCMRPQVKP